MATPPAAKHEDFTEWKRSVESRLRTALARAASRPILQVNEGGFDITDDGSVRIFGSGGLSMISGDSVEIFSVKGWDGSLVEPDGDPQPMIHMRRADGSVAFFLGDPAPDVGGYQQFWALYDRNGTIVFGDDTTSGRGLARPYTSYNILDENGSDYVTPTSTAAFATVHVIAGYVQSPRMAVPVTCNAPGTGAAEIRIIHDGTAEVVAGPTAVAAGASAAPFYEFNVPESVGMFTYQYFSVQTRRTSGTGNVQSRTWSAHGIQS
jgi:hypothetical protein